MAPKKRTTRATPTTVTTPTTTITNAQLQALVDRGVAAILAERDTDRSRNGKHLDMVKLLHEGCWTGCCLCNAVGRFEKNDQIIIARGVRSKRWNLTKMERYIGGLPDMIHGSVKASKPQSMQEAIEFATKMTYKKMLTHAKRQAKHKRKFDDTLRNNQHQQQPLKRNNVARAYTVGQRDRKLYGGTKPL
nr:hypothetical protein [Tanacetum cinerariifolium]